MTQTAKERIEEEIKDVNRSLVYSLNKNGRAFNSGKRQGLTIALAHVENAGQSQHSKLGIPKKIAEELDTILKEYPGWIYEGFHRLASRSLMMWCEHNNGFNNCVAYLAGKALGVELVEVEG